jgi:hypothetical protein
MRDYRDSVVQPSGSGPDFKIAARAAAEIESSAEPIEMNRSPDEIAPPMVGEIRIFPSIARGMGCWTCDSVYVASASLATGPNRISTPGGVGADGSSRSCPGVATS